MPIINPIWFYLMNICCITKLISMFIFILSFLFLLFFIFMGNDDYFIDDEDDVKSINKSKKVLLILTIISGILCIFIPSEETMMYMLVSKNITYERLEQGEQKVKEIVDYIIDKTQSNE